jgi:DNA-directed RNA polymerase subunit RPC12/RpoP
MSSTRETLKLRLVKEYADHLDKLFAGLDPDAELHLTEIEEAALELRQRTGEAVTRALVERQTRLRGPDVACPKCGGRMRYKGKKRKYLRSRSGEMAVERPYYYCMACQTGHFPPG